MVVWIKGQRMDFHAAVEGFGLGASLIVAIGAQNALVLRQGLLRSHVGPVVAFCAVSDAVLILAGALGLGALIQAVPSLLLVVTFGGAAFLLWYGIAAARRALRPGALLPTEEPPKPLKALLVTLAGVTLLNPHVYLDTVILLGSISARYTGEGRMAFVIGAMLSSLTWFSVLGYGARLLRPVFRSPRAWRILDVIIALVMWSIALGLGAEGFRVLVRAGQVGAAG